MHPLQAVGFVILCFKAAPPSALAIIRPTSSWCSSSCLFFLILLLLVLQPVVPSLHCVLPLWPNRHCFLIAASRQQITVPPTVFSKHFAVYLYLLRHVCHNLHALLLLDSVLYCFSCLHTFVSVQAVFSEP